MVGQLNFTEGTLTKGLNNLVLADALAMVMMALVVVVAMMATGCALIRMLRHFASV